MYSEYEEIATDQVQGKPQAPDLSNAQTRASAYFSSWGTWASEKRKGWGNKTPLSSPPPDDTKRAEDFKREMDATLGADTPATSPPPQDVKRRSLVFDAEGDKTTDDDKAHAKKDEADVEKDKVAAKD